MRIAFVTNPDGWEVPVYADALRKQGHKVVAIVTPLSPQPVIGRWVRRQRRPASPPPRTERTLLLRAWTARTRRFLRDYSALRAYCRKHRLPLIHVWSLASFRAARALKTARPDILFSASLSHLVPRTLTRTPRLAAVNIHGGLLPEYAGRDAAERALSDRTRTTGVTFHLLSPHFDSGRIILRRSMPIRGHPTPDLLAEQLIRLAASSLPECIRRLTVEHKSRS